MVTCPSHTEACPRRMECELNEVRLLFMISNELNQRRSITDTLYQVIKILSEHGNVVRGMIAILERGSSLIQVEAAYGLNPEARERGKYRLGEGIIGKAIQNNSPIIVPRIAEEPRFLDRTQSRSDEEKKELAFLCVPISVNGTVAGAIAVDLRITSDENFEEDVRILSTVGNIVARSVQARQEELEEIYRLEQENKRLAEQLASDAKPGSMTGSSKAMQEVYRQIHQVAPTNTTILIRGESGVGKELVAQAIHYNSPRANGPFVGVNLGALPEDLIESELFGYEPGAFTSATKLKRGRFELAAGGTLFLDEFGDISHSMQIKLLRVLQEREFERLGGTQTIKADVRVVCATNRNLEKMMREGQFREDLYYRINVFPVHVPPLRERSEDIPLLANHFIQKFNKKNGATIQRLSSSALEVLLSYSWPGNVRELENCIERACILAHNGIIYAFDLPSIFRNNSGAESEHSSPPQSLDRTLDGVEREMIIDALKATNGNVSQAAKRLGITERVMGIRIRKHSIDPFDYKRRAGKSEPA